MNKNDGISVEVAFALPNKQKIVTLSVDHGTSALEAARQSGIAVMFPNIDIETANMGIFGKLVKPATYIMQAGERVEIYRSLIADPKEVRKARAQKAKEKRLEKN